MDMTSTEASHLGIDLTHLSKQKNVLDIMNSSFVLHLLKHIPSYIRGIAVFECQKPAIMRLIRMVDCFPHSFSYWFQNSSHPNVSLISLFIFMFGLYGITCFNLFFLLGLEAFRGGNGSCWVHVVLR